MSINRISGNILQDNLQRGANLSIQGNLIYFDVTSNRVGIKTSTLSDDFTVANVANVGNLRIASATTNAVVFTNSARLATATSNLTFDGSTLTAAGNISAGNIVADGPTIEILRNEPLLNKYRLELPEGFAF